MDYDFRIPLTTFAAGREPVQSNLTGTVESHSWLALNKVPI